MAIPVAVNKPWGLLILVLLTLGLGSLMLRQ